MKLTCISDIHLNHYTTHEFYKGFRDEQFLRAADRVIEISKENQSKVLCILGDFIDVPTLVPKAVHLLIDMMSKFSDYYDDIYYILGQHDLDSKINEISESDTLITILSQISPKFHYMNGKTIQLGGRNVYFRNFVFSTDVIDDVPECDIFLGHVTLHEQFGQTIDPINYKLGVFGDIHSRVDLGVNHSVGGFLQKNMNDTPYGSVATIDTDTFEFKRTTLINKNHKFLRIYNEGTEVDPDEFTVINRRSNQVTSIELKSISNEDIKEVKLSDLDSIILGKLKELDLLDLHKDIVSRCTVYDKISFNFELINLKVHNFRSIADFEIDFRRYNHLLYISGKNGSGKTSLINALYTALVGDRRIRYDMKRGQSDIRLEVTLNYNGLTYQIIRGAGYTQFFINGEAISKNNKTELENYIYECLPFLCYLHVFYVRAKSNYFINLFNSRLIYKLFGIDNFAQYYSNSWKDIKVVNGEIYNTNSEIENNNGRLSVLKTSISAIESEITRLTDELSKFDEISISKIPEISKLRSLIKDIEVKKSRLSSDINIDMDRFNSLKDSESKLSNATSRNDQINRAKQRVKRLRDELVKLDNTSNKIKCPNCGVEFIQNSSFIDSRKVDINSELSELLPVANSELIDTSVLSQNVIEYRSYNDKFSELKKLEVLNQSHSEYVAKLAEVMIPEYESKSSDELSSINSKFIEITSNLKMRKSELSAKTAEITSTETKLTELHEKLESLNSKLSKLMTYNSLFDESNPTSIHKEVIFRISETLSDDQISFISKDSSEEENLGFQLKVDDDWIDYSRCSTGQQAFMDIKLINKLFSLLGDAGLLILDEIIANVDQSNLENCLSLIRSVQCKHIIMTSHNTTINNDFDSKLDCELVNNCSIFK